MKSKVVKSIATKTHPIGEIFPIFDSVLTEGVLDAMITSTVNLAHLKVLLQIKILRGNCLKNVHCIDKLLNNLGENNCDYACDALYLYLLLCEAAVIDRYIRNVLSYVNKVDCAKKEGALIALKLLKTLLDVLEDSECSTLDETVIDFQLLLRIYYNAEVYKWNDVKNQLILNVLNRCVRNQKITTSLWDVFLLQKDFYAMACLVESVPLSVVVSQSLSLWKTLRQGITEDFSGDRKYILHVSKKFVDFILNRGIQFNIQEIITCGDSNMSKCKKMWSNFFILLDILQEKQLHLIVPSLVLLDTLSGLGPAWMFSLYSVMLSHAQDTIVFRAATDLLKLLCFKGEPFFREVVKSVIRSINRSAYSECSRTTFKELSTFASLLNDEEFSVVMEESSNVAWVPTAAWSFYYSVFPRDKYFRDVNNVIKFITTIRRIPHKFIRNSCLRHVLHLLSFEPSDYDYSSQDVIKMVMCLFESFPDVREDIELILVQKLENEFLLQEIDEWGKNEHVNLNRVHLVSVAMCYRNMKENLCTFVSEEKFHDRVSDKVIAVLADFLLPDKLECCVNKRLGCIKRDEHSTDLWSIIDCDASWEEMKSKFDECELLTSNLNDSQIYYILLHLMARLTIDHVFQKFILKFSKVLLKAHILEVRSIKLLANACSKYMHCTIMSREILKNVYDILILVLENYDEEAIVEVINYLLPVFGWRYHCNINIETSCKDLIKNIVKRTLEVVMQFKSNTPSKTAFASCMMILQNDYIFDDDDEFFAWLFRKLTCVFSCNEMMTVKFAKCLKSLPVPFRRVSPFVVELLLYNSITSAGKR